MKIFLFFISLLLYSIQLFSQDLSVYGKDFTQKNPKIKTVKNIS